MVGRKQTGEWKGEGKNSIGNVEAKKLVCTTHGHEIRGVGKWEWERVCRAEGSKGGGWDNSNSIINKIYFLKMIMMVNLILCGFITIKIWVDI